MISIWHHSLFNCFFDPNSRKKQKKKLLVQETLSRSNCVSKIRSIGEVSTPIFIKPQPSQYTLCTRYILYARSHYTTCWTQTHVLCWTQTWISSQGLLAMVCICHVCVQWRYDTSTRPEMVNIMYTWGRVTCWGHTLGGVGPMLFCPSTCLSITSTFPITKFVHILSWEGQREPYISSIQPKNLSTIGCCQFISNGLEYTILGSFKLIPMSNQLT